MSSSIACSRGLTPAWDVIRGRLLHSAHLCEKLGSGGVPSPSQRESLSQSFLSATLWPRVAICCIKEGSLARIQRLCVWHPVKKTALRPKKHLVQKANQGNSHIYEGAKVAHKGPTNLDSCRTPLQLRRESKCGLGADGPYCPDLYIVALFVQQTLLCELHPPRRWRRVDVC